MEFTGMENMTESGRSTISMTESSFESFSTASSLPPPPSTIVSRGSTVSETTLPSLTNGITATMATTTNNTNHNKKNEPFMDWMRFPADMTMPRHLFVGVAVENCVLVMGGECATRGRLLRTVERLDFGRNELNWERITSMSTARSACAAAVAVMGTNDTTTTRTATNATTSTTTTTTTTNMTTESSSSGSDNESNISNDDASTSIKNPGMYRIVVMGGWDGRHYLNSAEMYNPNVRQWTPLPSMSTNRLRFAATAIGSKVFCIGGYDGNVHLDSAEVLDLNTLEWTSLPSMTKKRSNCCVVSFSDLNQIYVMAGYDESSFHNSMEMLDLETTTWTMLPKMTTKRSGCAATPVVLDIQGKKNHFVFCMGGRNGSRSYLRTAEVYHVEQKTWITLPPMSSKRHGCAAVTINNQDVLVIGGCDGSSGGAEGGFFGDAEQLQGLSSVLEMIVMQSSPAPTFPPSTTTVTTPLTSASTSSTSQGPSVSNESNVTRAFTAQLVPSTPPPVAAAPHTEINLIDLDSPAPAMPTKAVPEAPSISNKSGVSLPEPPALPGLPTGVGSSRRERKKALEEWTETVEETRDRYEKSIKAFREKIDREANERNRFLEEEIVRLMETVRKYRAEVDANTQRLDDVVRDIEASAQSWRDTVQEQLEDVQDQIEMLTLKMNNHQNNSRRVSYHPPSSSSSSSQSHYTDANRRASSYDGPYRQRNNDEGPRLMEPPRQLICPITQDLMVDPVLAADGHTYEREAITKVFATTPPDQNPKSPVTGEELSSRNVFPNVAIRSQCREYQEVQAREQS